MLLSEFDGVSFFFFKQKTAYEMRISDWSSDVCSSDLQPLAGTRVDQQSVRVVYRRAPIAGRARCVLAVEKHAGQRRQSQQLGVFAYEQLSLHFDAQHRAWKYHEMVSAGQAGAVEQGVKQIGRAHV